MAERLLAEAFKKEGGALACLEVASAGVAAYEGTPASAYAVAAMKEVGLDISDHRSRLLTREMVQDAGMILAMTEMHVVAIQEEYGKLADGKLFLFRQWMPLMLQVGDPFGANLEVYRACRKMIAEAVPSVVTQIKSRFAI
jgi:protein-tyrosine-phosphatase